MGFAFPCSLNGDQGLGDEGGLDESKNFRLACTNRSTSLGLENCLRVSRLYPVAKSVVG